MPFQNKYNILIVTCMIATKVYDVSLTQFYQYGTQKKLRKYYRIRQKNQIPVLHYMVYQTRYIKFQHTQRKSFTSEFILTSRISFLFENVIFYGCRPIQFTGKDHVRNCRILFHEIHGKRKPFLLTIQNSLSRLNLDNFVLSKNY